ncbi:hypothetical protein GE061_002950 [Apolygus lucorum]|uniref:Peptidase S1 domain-containing protein n=1 Tax=Apolygus lucorum TaxID=248454 RepID=A0A6A4IXN8_APOLU|nr:hypothetical protein GE061_002950 [Apolygus lucorum]
MKRELICLYVGFGRYYYEKVKPEAIYAGVPSILQHGWRTLRNYWQCYVHTESYLQDWYGKPFYASIPLNYSRDGTWACTTFFGKERAITGPGDSGGPVTCGGVYFGLVQSSVGDFISETGKSWEHIALIAFAIFENAAEYREAMEHHLWAIWGRPDEPVPGVLGRSTINPFNPDAFYSTVVPFDQE